MPAPVDIRSAMRTKGRPGDREIAAIAERQHGVVAGRQLRAAGFHASAIRRRVAAGRLHPLHAGVYAVGHRVVSQHGRWMAAVLACGDRALLSHRSAAALWGILLTAGSGVDVTARTCGGRPGVVLHWPRRVHDQDRAVCDGIPVTAVPCTLLNLAQEVSARRLRPRQLSRALEAAELKGLFDLAAMERLIARSRGRPGMTALRAALLDYRPQVFTRSKLERRFLDLCERAGLPRPAANAVVAGDEVDMLWRTERLVVELDGEQVHRTRAAFERDRRRDTALQIAGYRVVRITDRRTADSPHEVAETVRLLLNRA
jgi:hypothetical protein